MARVADGQRAYFLTELGASLMNLVANRGTEYAFTPLQQEIIATIPARKVRSALSREMAARFGGLRQVSPWASVEGAPRGEVVSASVRRIRRRRGRAKALGLEMPAGELYALDRTGEAPFYFVISRRGISRAKRLEP